jgi:hypothetical protein
VRIRGEVRDHPPPALSQQGGEAGVLRALLAGRPAPWLGRPVALAGSAESGWHPIWLLSAAMTEKAALPASMQRPAAERLPRFQALRAVLSRRRYRPLRCRNTELAAWPIQVPEFTDVTVDLCEPAAIIWSIVNSNKGGDETRRITSALTKAMEHAVDSYLKRS